MQLVRHTIFSEVGCFTFPHTRWPHRFCIWMLPVGAALGERLRREHPQLFVLPLRRFAPRTDFSRPHSHRQAKKGWLFLISSKRRTLSMPCFFPVSSLNRRLD